jgi:hypothetical protein
MGGGGGGGGKGQFCKDITNYIACASRQRRLLKTNAEQQHTALIFRDMQQLVPGKVVVLVVAAARVRNRMV